MSSTNLAAGAIVRSASLAFEQHDGYQLARIVGPHLGAKFVRLDAVRVAAGRRWISPATDVEQVLVVHTGSGTATVAEQSAPIERAATVYAPTGSSLEVHAETELFFYLWNTVLLPGRPTSESPRHFSSLWNEETQLSNFAGTGQVNPADRIATMNFVFWPGTGSAQLCLHCGIQQPGETFSVHLHQESEDAFVAFEGSGQMYLGDRFIDVGEGDVLFAPPLVLHGTRQPDTGPEARRFVTCGGPVPYDTFLYDAAKVSSEVV